MVESGHVWLVVLAAVIMSGCAEFERVKIADETGFDHLYDRQLSAFEQQLAARRLTGEGGPWLALGQSWFEFATCREVEQRRLSGTSGATMAEYLAATLRLEDRRRRARRSESLQRRASLTAVGASWLGRETQSKTFFQLEPVEPSSDEVRWPSDREHWPDERPAAVKVETACPRVQVDRAVDRQRRRVLQAAARVESVWRAMPEQQRRGALAALRDRVRWYAGTTAFRYASVYEPSDDETEKPDGAAGPESAQARDAASGEPAIQLEKRALERRARRYLEPMVRERAEARGLSESRRARTLLMLAVLELRQEPETGRARRKQREQALARVMQAREVGLSGRNRWSARYLALRELSRQGRWGEASSLASPRPSSESELYAPYAYRAGVALEQTDAESQFLGLIKDVFRDHRAEASPFLEALHARAMRHLAAYPFDRRIVEVLEELGPRAELYDRLETYARAAIGRGHTDAAEAAAEWLLRYHADARARPKYRAILALAAFQRDDPEAFRQQIGEIASRPESLMQAIPPGRRASFFAPADAALARILRLTLPMMAEWGESPAATQRRDRWLRIIVGEVQEFLRTTRESVARPALEEMYRLASEQLSAHPRGYAERIGAEQPSTLVLGTVTVGAQDLSTAEPTIDVEVDMPYSLTLVPRGDREPRAWPARWPESEQRDAARADGASAGG
jgi:hypothetical protein